VLKALQKMLINICAKRRAKDVKLVYLLKAMPNILLINNCSKIQAKHVKIVHVLNAVPKM